MNQETAKIATICECIDHCFAYSMWCEDFAQHVDADDMVGGLQRAFEVISDATRLHSFLALRKLDDFLGGAKPRKDDLIASSFGIDVEKLLGGPEATFLSTEERENINKGVAHLTEKLTLDQDSEVDLHSIIKRSMPILEGLVAELRKFDAEGKAKHWLDKTEALINKARKH